MVMEIELSDGDEVERNDQALLHDEVAAMA